MGRWTQYDEVRNDPGRRLLLSHDHALLKDEHRLPEGMKRIGYDADTQKYRFRDTDGTVWEGQEGSEFGALTRGPIYLLN